MTKNLINKLHLTRGRIDELTDLEKNSSIHQFYDYMEKEFPDSSFYYDVNIDSLIEYLHEAGFSDDLIIRMNNNRYGHIVVFTYLTDLEMYVMEVTTL